MRAMFVAVALGAAALCSVAAMASVGSAPQPQISTAQRAGAIRALDKLAKPDAPNYTRVADNDEDGSCWYQAVGYTGCELSPRSQCFSGAFVTKIFISGGTCDSSEKPF